MNKKITFFPGWMYSAEYFTLGEGINIWKEDINFNRSLGCDFLIGHSMGAAVALKLWLLDKDKKLVLVNPFIERKNIFKAAIHWFRFYFQEGIKYTECFLGFKYFPRNIAKFLKLSEENYWKILKDVPKNQITILHGANDRHLCGDDICKKIKSFGFNVVEISEAGDYWHKNFDDAIMEIVNS
jgi:hypothetical protein